MINIRNIIVKFLLRGSVAVSLLLLVALPSGVLAQSTSGKMPVIEVIEGQVIRKSEKKGNTGQFLPPWNKVEVTNVTGFNIRPRVGSRATIVPLDAGLEPFDLEVKKSEMQQGCDDLSIARWSAEFETIKDKRFFDAPALSGRSDEYPFDTVVIYPAVSSSRQIPRSSLTKAMLPSGVSAKIVKAAIDVTNDGKPDILVTEFCCNDTSSSGASGECDYTCGATYERSGNTWKKVATSTPC